MRILIVEDDISIANLIHNILRKNNFTCDTTDTVEDSIRLAKINDYDIVILDIKLPDGSGQDVIRNLRLAKNYTPIIVLSALDAIEEKVMSLTTGADDFIIKPVSAQELIARIQAVIRRNMGYAESKIKIGKLILNLKTKIVTVDNNNVNLTNKEYEILQLLMIKRGHAINKENFLNHLYDEEISEPSIKIVDVFMCKLRKKLEKFLGKEEYITTLWGRGYMITDKIK